MSRTTLLVTGSVAWTVALGDALVHANGGDMVVPGGMAFITVAYIAIRQLMIRSRARVTART